ncbi:MAG: DUF1697 domain-containing protein, partial [Candidatus Wallbacteria bacterium]|nr:DUF1697 domain-containing protein [Candidatus Wallbacteria bacterium]
MHKGGQKLTGFVALFRGINVGKTKRVEMARLKSMFESLGCADVSTYINSGNVIFAAGGKAENIGNVIASALDREFGFYADILIKTRIEMKKIAGAIPAAWRNDSVQKTEVAYLST